MTLEVCAFFALYNLASDCYVQEMFIVFKGLFGFHNQSHFLHIISWRPTHVDYSYWLQNSILKVQFADILKFPIL